MLSGDITPVTPIVISSTSFTAMFSELTCIRPKRRLVILFSVLHKKTRNFLASLKVNRQVGYGLNIYNCNISSKTA